MKKIISMLLVAVMCCGLLVGCGGKPSGMNEDIYSYGVKAVEVVDSYLASDLTAEEVEEKVEALLASAESIETEESIDDSVKSSLSLLAAQFRYISFQELSGRVDSEELSEVRETRDDLKEELNMK